MQSARFIWESNAIFVAYLMKSLSFLNPKETNFTLQFLNKANKIPSAKIVFAYFENIFIQTKIKLNTFFNKKIILKIQ